MRLVWAAFLLSLSTQVVAPEALRPLLDFDGPETAQKWQAVNDGVMGGVSDGRFRITEEKTLKFFGTLSLEAGPTIDFAVPCVLRAGATNHVGLFGRNLPGGRPSPFHGADGAALQCAEMDLVVPAATDPAAWPTDQLRRPAQASAAEESELGTIIAMSAGSARSCRTTARNRRSGSRL